MGRGSPVIPRRDDKAGPRRHVGLEMSGDQCHDLVGILIGTLLLDEVGEVARLVQGNLPAECWTKEVEVAWSLPSSRKVLPFRSFLQYFDQIVVEVVAIEMAMAVEVVEMELAFVVACLQE